MPTTSLEHHYETVRTHIEGDTTILKLRETRRSAEIDFEHVLNGIDESLSAQLKQIVLRYKLGYASRSNIARALPEANSIPDRQIRGVTISTYRDSEGDHDFYFSRQLHMWVAGSPEDRSDGLYCHITGKKLSTD